MRGRDSGSAGGPLWCTVVSELVGSGCLVLRSASVSNSCRPLGRLLSQQRPLTTVLPLSTAVVTDCALKESCSVDLYQLLVAPALFRRNHYHKRPYPCIITHFRPALPRSTAPTCDCIECLRIK